MNMKKVFHIDTHSDDSVCGYSFEQKHFCKRLRVLLASTAALVSLPAFAWLAAELAVYYEMFSTGMNSRAELGDDLGFGILIFMVVPPFTLAGTAFVWWLVWSRTGRSKTTLLNGDANA